MATNAKSAAQKPEDPTVPKGSSKKLLVIIAIIVVAGLAAGGGWYFTKGKSHDSHTEELKVEPPKTPIFMPLEPFTVNLKSETSDQYLQMGISMKMFEPEIETKIKTSLPEVRSKILQLLTTKTADDLLTAEGKNKLVKEIILMSNATIDIVDMTGAKSAMVPAASQVAESVDEANADDAPKTPTPHAAVKAPEAKKGIVDVLFTSFIIQ